MREETMRETEPLRVNGGCISLPVTVLSDLAVEDGQHVYLVPCWDGYVLMGPQAYADYLARGGDDGPQSYADYLARRAGVSHVRLDPPDTAHE